MTKRILIIGQGLAGTILSAELFRRNIWHKVLDNNHKTASTKAAAGIINPITGRRYVKSWMIDELLLAAKASYRYIEKLLDTQLVDEIEIVRTWDDLVQEKQWFEATSRVGYEPYISANTDMGGYQQLVTKPFGFGRISKALKVKVSEMIVDYRLFLEQQGRLVTADFDHDQLSRQFEEITLTGERFDTLIFCEGHRAVHNPLFANLPFQLVKGESFVVRSKQHLPQDILRARIFIAPVTRNEFWTGGGYYKDDLTIEPSTRFHEEWTDRLSDLMLADDYSILAHRAGIRPSVLGRKPLIGRHRTFQNCYLFNGLGTKGTSLAPYWARELIALVMANKSMDPQVDLNRFEY